MAAFWPLRGFVLVVFLICVHRNYGKRTEIKGDIGKLDAQKAKEVHNAVSSLLQHKIGKKLKEAADEVKHAVDHALGKHLDNAHHILKNKDADVIVMDPKLSKLVKNAVKVGKKEKKKKIGAKAHKAHDFHRPRAAFHGAQRRPVGSNQYGRNPYSYNQGFGAQPRYPQSQGYPQGQGYPQRQGYNNVQSPLGYPANQGYTGYPQYPGSQQQGTQTPNYPGTPGFTGYPATQSYPSQGMPGVPGQGYGAQQPQYMPNGCSQSCQQNCYLMCPRKCCSDKKSGVTHHKKSKVHHVAHDKKLRVRHSKHGKHHLKKEHKKHQ